MNKNIGIFEQKYQWVLMGLELQNEENIGRYVMQGFRVIMSNYDAWYLDCGYGGWVGPNNNWCSPYKGWQALYDNSPRQIYRSHTYSFQHISKKDNMYC